MEGEREGEGLMCEIVRLVGVRGVPVGSFVRMLIGHWMYFGRALGSGSYLVVRLCKHSHLQGVRIRLDKQFFFHRRAGHLGIVAAYS